MKTRLFIFLLNLLMLLTVKCQDNNVEYKNPDIPLQSDWGNIDFYHVHLTKTSGYIGAGEKLGVVQPYPDTLSHKFDQEIRLSKQYYMSGDYQNAKEVLLEAVNEESDNYFILENYARACYKIDTAESFRIYKKLVGSLDSALYDSDYQIAVDFWHREAYWKLGTLYMDRGLWNAAYYEISRFMLCIQNEKGQFVYNQALEYLTECAYNLYDDELTKYLAERTLYYNPNNDYVKSILKKIKK